MTEAVWLSGVVAAGYHDVKSSDQQLKQQVTDEQSGCFGKTGSFGFSHEILLRSSPPGKFKHLCVRIVTKLICSVRNGETTSTPTIFF